LRGERPAAGQRNSANIETAEAVWSEATINKEASLFQGWLLKFAKQVISLER
jgi:hypothetical protein